LISRESTALHKFAAELKTGGTDVRNATPFPFSFLTCLTTPSPPASTTTQAAAFPISDYTYKEVQTAFRAVRTHWPTSDIRVALYNAGFGVWKPFLQLTEDEVDKVIDTNVKAAFAFSREAITAFQGQGNDEHGKRGTLLFTGATASLRGNTTTSSFSAAKFALRSLSQSLNKEFGKENIHVCASLWPDFFFFTNES
jgi:NAD(P)-dependent dehydrogenase (short-subunit alcohol dehydrogenase family)